MLLRTPRTVTAHTPWRILPSRAHSSHAAPPSFAPTGSTSADTEVPYGDPSLASSAYLPRKDGAPPLTPEEQRATSEAPPLTPRQKRVLERIIRVDQAGELGANYIYYGQHAVLNRGKDKHAADLVQVRLTPPRHCCFRLSRSCRALSRSR